ncbi:MAG: PEP-CTERM sorting domain-containing protein [Pirellula sp.]|jgi:hypothetical protein
MTRKFIVGLVCAAASLLTASTVEAAALIVMPQQTLSSAGGTGGAGKNYGPFNVAFGGPAFHGRLTVTLMGDFDDIASNQTFGSTTGRGESIDFNLEGVTKVRVGRFSLNDPGFSVVGNTFKLVKSFTINLPSMSTLLADGNVSFSFNQSQSVGAGSTVNASISTVPEPATFAVLGLGATVIAGAARIRKRK